MSLPLRLRYAFGILLLGALVGMLIDVCRQSDAGFNPLQLVRRPASVQTRDDAALLSGWLDEVDNSWEVGKNHQHVRAAFKDVVVEARKSTVRVLRDGEQVALGTVVDSAGYVLTKASEVVDGEGVLTCQLVGGRKRPAEIVGMLLRHDLAMLKINADRLTAVQWYTDATPEVGSLLATPYLGSAPLAVGVLSLAPLEVANNGVLGIRLRNSDEGPFVTDVIEASAADQAGLSEGDIVVRIGDEPVSTSDELVSMINQRLPGEAVALAVRRGEEELTLTATLGRRTELDQENVNFQGFLGGELSFRRTGFQSVLQHDTFLLPEHCGGPLVDLEGRVVGINIARAERIASYALPAAAITPWIDGLKNGAYDSLVVRNQQPSSESTEAR